MIITITNGKGGTGKTTLGTFLAEWLYAHGHKVLVVDCDPNCSISEIYGLRCLACPKKSEKCP